MPEAETYNEHNRSAVQIDMLGLKMLCQRFICLFIAVAIANSSVSASAAERELIFPDEFQHGSISLFGQPKTATYMSGIIRFPYAGKFFSAAEGVVRVPASSWVSVEIDGESGYQGFVDSLPRTGIDRLELRGATMSTAVIASIEKLKTLRQVILVDCRVAEIDPSKLAGSPALQEFSIRGTDSEEQWRGLMPWLIKCPAIQILFGGNPMSVTDLKRWSHHNAPVFLSANLDNNAGNVLDALENFPGLVGLELTISDDVSSSDLARVGTLKSVELIVLNDGLLNADLVAVLARLPKLKVLRIQGSTKIGDFLSGGFPLESIQAVSFTRSLEPSLNKRFVDVCLELRSLRELPALENATAAQLRKLASRNQYTRFSVYGLDESANESMVSKVILQNPHLTRLTLANVQLTAELGSAISTCSQLENLRLSTERFNGGYLKPEMLSSVKYLNISSRDQPRALDMLTKLRGVKQLVASFGTCDPLDGATLASIPSLEGLTIEDGLCDTSTALEVGKSANIERFTCRKSCLFDDAAISELLKNDRLTDLNIGGYLSEEAISKLSGLAKLTDLVIHSDLIDDNATNRLRNHLRQLEDFEVRPLDLSMGYIFKGSDGLERWLPTVGRKAIDELEGKSMDELFGKQQVSEIRSGLDGKITLVEFWGTWCGPCLAYESELERLHQEYYRDGLRIISVHSEQGHEQANAYLRKHPKQWQTITDATGELANSFNVPGYPSLYVFGENGRLLVALPHRLVLERTILELLNKGGEVSP